MSKKICIICSLKDKAAVYYGHKPNSCFIKSHKEGQVVFSGDALLDIDFTKERTGRGVPSEHTAA